MYPPTVLSCDCGATARNTTKERGRFFRRHPITPATSEADLQAHIDDQRHLKKLALEREAIRTQKTKNDAAATATIAALFVKALIKGHR